MKKRDIAIIYWEDSAVHSPGNNQIPEKLAMTYGVIKGVSAGTIIKETEDLITLALDFFPGDNKGVNWNGEDQFRFITTYPKSAISRIRRVKT